MNYKIWTDGSSIDQKYGGWAYLIILGDKSVTKSGRESNCTNNQAELLAVYKALQDQVIDWSNLETIEIFTDSVYVLNMLVKNWKPKVNREVIYGIKDYMNGHKVIFHKTKAHSNDHRNIHVDKLAYIEADRLKNEADKSSRFTVTVELEKLGENRYVAYFKGVPSITSEGRAAGIAIKNLIDLGVEQGLV